MRLGFGAPVAPVAPGDGSLGGGQAGDRHTVGGAGGVVHADLAAGLDGAWFTAAVAADTDFELGVGLAAQFDGQPLIVPESGDHRHLRSTSSLRRILDTNEQPLAKGAVGGFDLIEPGDVG